MTRIFFQQQKQKASDYVVHLLTYQAKEDSGNTKQRELEFVQQKLGIQKAIVPEVPKLPVDCHRAWDAFIELSTRREELKPITFQEIESYTKLYRITLNTKELDYLSEFDNAFVKTMLDKQMKRVKQQESDS